MDKMRITIILILTCIIIVSTTCLAATGIVNAPSGLVLRESASKSSKPLTTVSDSSKVEIIEKTGEWYKVKYGNYEGYLFAQYVNPQEEVAEQTTETEQPQAENVQENTQQNAVTEETANVTIAYPQNVNTTVEVKAYIIPSITSRVLLNIEVGKEITVNGELNNWFNITYEGKTYWIRKNSINVQTTTVENTPAQENTTTEQTTEVKPQTSTETTIENKKGYINVSSSANIRESASTSAKILNTLNRNTEVTIIAEADGFYKIQYKDITGYVAKSLISDTPVAATSRTNTGERATQAEQQTAVEATQSIEPASESTENVRCSTSTTSSIFRR